jgi:hypothetical protein
MKTFLSCFLISAVAASAGTFVQQTPVEFAASGDFNGDSFPDVLVLDKGTGLYRVAYGTGSGGPTFSDSRPSGVPNPSGVALGKIHGTLVESFAVTAVEQNRVQILSPTAPGVIVPVSVLSAGHGPQVLAALDLPLGASPTSEDDLVLVASRDPVDASQIRQIRSNAGTWPLLSTLNIADNPARHGNPIPPANAAPALFAFIRDTGASDSFHAFQVDGSTATSTLTVPGLAKDTAFICDVFDGTQADLMLWQPGTKNVRVRHIVPSGPSWIFSGDLTFNLGSDIAQLAVVETPGGKRVLVRFEHGGLAEFTYTAASGFSSPTPIPVSGAPGVPSGLVPLPGNAFHLLQSPVPGGPSDSIVSFVNSGSGWTQTGVHTLPPLKKYSAFANVMLLDSPLFRNDFTKLLQSYQVPDWSTGVLAGPPVVVDAAPFASTTTGIGTPAAQTLGPPAATPGGTAVNQLHTQFSLFSFDSNLGEVPDAVKISPDPGTYDVAQKIEFTGLSGGTSVRYRLGQTGTFQVWNAASPPWITRPVTVEFYADSASGPGAVQTARYEFNRPAALQDTDGDGVPDFVELSYGMDPAGGPDADEDGFSDFDEVAAGTNPNDVGDKPGSNGSSLDAMIVDARAQLRDTAGTVLAVAADGTRVTVSDAFGNELGARDIGVAAPATYARVRTRAVDPKMGFLVVRTEKHFSTDPAGTNEPRGRELIGLVPALEPEAWSFATTDGVIGTPTAWSWGGTNWQAGSSNWNNGPTDTQGFDASWSTLQTNPNWDSSPSGTWSSADWEAQLQTAANRGARPYAQITLTPGTSLGALIVSKAMENFILERDPAASMDAAELLFGNPDAFDALRRSSTTVPTASIVRTIAVLRHVDDELAGSGLGAQALRKLARDVYAQHNALATTDLDLLPMPLDALATFVDTGALPAAYLTATSLTPAEQSAASAKLTSILSTVPERSTTTQTLYVRSGTPTPGLSLANDASSTAKLLLNDKILALTLPDENEAPAGTPLQITAYTDLPDIAGFDAWEVTSLTLSSLPNVVDEDSDGDLLADSWELRHFGTLDNDGYGNRDGSLYSLMQEYFDGTDPRISSSSPLLPPVEMVIRDFDITTLAPGSFRLRARWPAAYAHAVNLMMQGTPDLVEWLLPSAATDVGGGEFRATITTTDPRYFFRAFPQLKR